MEEVYHTMKPYNHEDPNLHLCGPHGEFLAEVRERAYPGISQKIVDALNITEYKQSGDLELSIRELAEFCCDNPNCRDIADEIREFLNKPCVIQSLRHL